MKYYRDRFSRKRIGRPLHDVTSYCEISSCKRMISWLCVDMRDGHGVSGQQQVGSLCLVDFLSS
jgi:hypothetical protein